MSVLVLGEVDRRTFCKISFLSGFLMPPSSGLEVRHEQLHIMASYAWSPVDHRRGKK